MPDTLQSLLAPIDTASVFRAADDQVDEIHHQHSRLEDGLDVLAEIAERVVRSPANADLDWAKLKYLIQMLRNASTGIVEANDRLTEILQPLKLDRGGAA